jgi:hypothetical protein
MSVVKKVGKIGRSLCKPLLALSVFLGGCQAGSLQKTEEGLRSPMIAGIDAYHKRLLPLCTKERLLHPTEKNPLPTQRDFLSAAYGTQTAAILAQIEEYRKIHPQYYYISHYRDEDLDFSPDNIKIEELDENTKAQAVQIIRDEDSIGYIVIRLSPKVFKGNDIDVNSVRHEYFHACCQFFTEKEVEGFSTPANERNRKLLNQEDILRDPSYNRESFYIAKYLIHPREFEVRQSAMQQGLFAMIGKIAATPAESLVALKKLGFDIDDNVVKDIFKEEGLALDESILKTRALPEAVLQKFYEEFNDVKHLRDFINGCKRPPSYYKDDISNKDDIPPLRTKNPVLYRNVLKKLITGTPGLALNNEGVQMNLG